MNFKILPVAWLTTVSTVLLAVLAANEVFHLLPSAVAAWVGFVSLVLVLYLGRQAHNASTPLADPRTANGRRLVPVPPADVPPGMPESALDAERK